METTPTNPSGAPPVSPQQPATGQVRGVAARVAGQTSAPGKPATVANGKVNKGGRRPFSEDLAKYLAETGQRLVPNQTAGDPGIVAPPQPAYVVTPEFVGDAVGTLLKGVDAGRKRAVFLRVKTIAGDDKLAKELSDTAGAPPGCIDTIQRGSVELAKKYPGMLQWAPEVTIAGAVGMWVTKDLELSNRLDALEKRIAKQLNDEVGKPEPAPPKPNPTP